MIACHIKHRKRWVMVCEKLNVGAHARQRAFEVCYMLTQVRSDTIAVVDERRRPRMRIM